MLQRGLNQPQPGSFLGVFCIGAIAKLLMPRSLKRSMLKEPSVKQERSDRSPVGMYPSDPVKASNVPSCKKAHVHCARRRTRSPLRQYAVGTIRGRQWGTSRGDAILDSMQY